MSHSEKPSDRSLQSEDELAADFIARRSQGYGADDFDAILAKVPDVAPDPGDGIIEAGSLRAE